MVIFKAMAMIAVPAILLATTYSIAEPDIMSQIEGKKGLLTKNMKKEDAKAKEKLSHMSGASLTKAQRSYAYYVDPTYTLPQDIPRVDREGHQIGILYPKGYTFNPLQYLMIAPPPIVAFNACDKKEMALAKALMKDRPDAMFASSGCEIDQFPKDTGRPLYLVTEEMKKKFDLKNTLSVVSVDLKVKRIKIEVYKTAR
jgi:conjugal transfer pilus assembly protein TraW